MPSAPIAENRYSNHGPRVGNFNEHTWGLSMSAIMCELSERFSHP